MTKPKTPRSPRSTATSPRGEPRQWQFSKAVIDELFGSVDRPEELFSSDGLLKGLMAALVDRAMEAELTQHLGYEEGEAPPPEQSNRRNGVRKKTVRSRHGPVTVAVPRDREGTFEPQLIPKHERSFTGFDEQILSLYSHGMSTREIEAHIRDLYGVDVSPDLVSRVTSSILTELEDWQKRPLEPLYPIVYLDALVVKVRDSGVVQNKSVYLVVGVDLDGNRTVLGMWIQHTEGAKFWLSILTELQGRGVKDILVLCADGLTGMPEAVSAAFPRTVFQTCIVHMIRSSTRYVPWSERREVCADLKKLYTAISVDAARSALDELKTKWERRHPTMTRAWETRFEEWTPFLAFPQEIRHAIYTTNAIESLNRRVRKVLKTRGALPTDDAAKKLIYLAIQNAGRWGGRTATWSQALLQFMVHFDDRISPEMLE